MLKKKTKANVNQSTLNEKKQEEWSLDHNAKGTYLFTEWFF